MNHSVVMSESVYRDALRHLIRSDYEEDICFGVWYPSAGASRFTAVLHHLVLPEPGERERHGNASASPDYVSRARREAVAARGGLAILHSHPVDGWQRLSPGDFENESALGPSTQAATKLPLLGITSGHDGYLSARFWKRAESRVYLPAHADAIRIVGKSFIFMPNPVWTPAIDSEILMRSISAWGEEKQELLSRLRIGIVGLGSVGSIVAAGLAKSGCGNLSFIDFDTVKYHNLDRLLLADRRDVIARRSKVEAALFHIQSHLTAKEVDLRECEFGVTEADGFAASLDCDILFSCVDKPWARYVLNTIAYAHMIPVIDGGLRLQRANDGFGLKKATWSSMLVGPGAPCLNCLDQFDLGDVSLERSGFLDDEHYIANLPKDSDLRAGENVFAFSLSTASALLEQFAGYVLRPDGTTGLKPLAYNFPSMSIHTKPQKCNPHCQFQELLGIGDHANVGILGVHQMGERERQERIAAKRGIRSV